MICYMPLLRCSRTFFWPYKSVLCAPRPKSLERLPPFQEDAALKAAVHLHGPKNWKTVATEWLGGSRSDVQCVHRWQKVLRPGLVKGNWTAEVAKGRGVRSTA